MAPGSKSCVLRQMHRSPSVSPHPPPCPPPPFPCPIFAPTNWQRYTGPLTILSNTLVLAKAEKHGYGSKVAFARYFLPTLSPPELSPPPPLLNPGSRLVLSSTNEGALLYYT